MTMMRGTLVIIVLLMAVVLTPAAGAADYSGPEIHDVYWTPMELSVGVNFILTAVVFASNDSVICSFSLTYKDGNGLPSDLNMGTLSPGDTVGDTRLFEKNFTVESGLMSTVNGMITAENFSGVNDSYEFEIPYEGGVKDRADPTTTVDCLVSRSWPWS